MDGQPEISTNLVPFSPADRVVVVLVVAPNSPGKSGSWMLASTQISFRIQWDEVELFVFCMAGNLLLTHICHSQRQNQVGDAFLN